MSVTKKFMEKSERLRKMYRIAAYIWESNGCWQMKPWTDDTVPPAIQAHTLVMDKVDDMIEELYEESLGKENKA